jgi:DNA polymerase
MRPPGLSFRTAHMKYLPVDVETRSLLDLRKVGAYQYARHPSTAVWVLGYVDADGEVKQWTPGDTVPPEILKAATDPEWRFAAFNANFERQIFQHVLRQYGFPVVPIEKWRCLQADALAHALPASLEDVAIALRLKNRKGDNKAMLALAKPRKDGSFDDDPAHLAKGLAYNAQDVQLELELPQRLPPLSEAEQLVWQLDQRINDFGFHVDGELLAGALKVAAAAEAEIEQQIREITGGEVETANQSARIIAWVAKHGEIIADVKKRTVAAALRRKNLAPEVHRLLQLRQAGAVASAKKFETMKAYRADDGRVRGCLRYHGAATGRWVGTGPQPQNLKRPTIADLTAAIERVISGDLATMKAHYEHPLEVVGEISRALICAPEGKRLIVGDFTGVESIVTAWLSGQHDKLDLWRRFIASGNRDDDPYIAIAARFGLIGENARDTGKRADLAFGYGGGLGAWRAMAPEGDATTDEEVERLKRAWRDAHPETVRYWYMLERAAIAAFQNPGTLKRTNKIAFLYEVPFLFAVLPSRRRTAYPYPRLITNRFGNSAVTFRDNAGGKFVDCNHGMGAYGGSLMENVVQATARDLLSSAMQHLEAAGYRIVLHIHDEIVAEVPLDFGSVDEFKRLMTMLPDWADGLPLAAKVRNGQRFAKIEAPSPDDLTPVDPPEEPAPGDPLEAEEKSSAQDPDYTFSRGTVEGTPREERREERATLNGHDEHAETFNNYTAENDRPHGRGRKEGE